MVFPDRRWALAALLILLTLFGCTPPPTAPGQAPHAPYRHDDTDMHGGGDDGGGSGSM